MVNRVFDQIVVAKKRDHDADTSALEREIDQQVYTLFGLTPEETAIVEGREAGEKQKTSVAKPAKVSASRHPRKSVMTDDPDLA